MPSIARFSFYCFRFLDFRSITVIKNLIIMSIVFFCFLNECSFYLFIFCPFCFFRSYLYLYLIILQLKLCLLSQVSLVNISRHLDFHQNVIFIKLNVISFAIFTLLNFCSFIFLSVSLFNNMFLRFF